MRHSPPELEALINDILNIYDRHPPRDDNPFLSRGWYLLCCLEDLGYAVTDLPYQPENDHVDNDEPSPHRKSYQDQGRMVPAAAHAEIKRALDAERATNADLQRAFMAQAMQLTHNRRALGQAFYERLQAIDPNYVPWDDLDQPQQAFWRNQTDIMLNRATEIRGQALREP